MADKRISLLLGALFISLISTSCVQEATTSSTVELAVITPISIVESQTMAAEPVISCSETVETTVTTIETTAPEVLSKEITISFLGDCSLATQKGDSSVGTMNYALANSEPTYFFEKCMDIIGADDFTIANCENVFTDNNLQMKFKDYSPAFWFKSPTKNANVFAVSSIDCVSLANNHTEDYGSQGSLDTRAALDAVNVLWGDMSNSVVLEKDGVKIGIVFATFYSEWWVEKIVSELDALQASTDIQIVFFHGGTEKIHVPENWKIAGAHSFVDHGADLVVGGHPHVLQPFEEYNGVPIVYSIGNFCYGGNRLPENRTVIFQETFILDSDNSITECSENIIPMYVYTGNTNNWQPAPITNEDEATKVLDFMYGKSDTLF